MKTIQTCLPIYDRIEKQCYHRSLKVSGDKAMIHPVITPRHKLPSFQWIDDGDGCTSVERIEAVNKDYIGEETSYSGTWTNGGFDTFTSVGLNITSAIDAVGSYADSSVIPIVKDAEYILRGTLTVNSGDAPYFLCSALSPNNIKLTAGSVEIAFNGLKTGNAVLSIYSPTACDFSFTMVTFVKVEDAVALDVYMPSKPSLVTIGSYDYFIYEDETLNYLLPTGEYYLKITMDNGYIYYSEWFLVDCVFANYLESWGIETYYSFSSSGTTITSAVATAPSLVASNSFNLVNNQEIKLIFYYRSMTSPAEEYPEIVLVNGTTLVEEANTVTEGLNEFTFTSDAAGVYYFKFTNTTNASWDTLEIIAFPEYSEKYLLIDFSHSCNLGNIVYDSGFQQQLYIESELLESAFPYVEKGAENGYGHFVPTFQRQDKTYSIKTKLVADYIIDVLHRLKLHDTIYLTDLVGDVYEVEEIDTEHTWQFDDKYYATANITVNLSEEIIITGCCSAVNQC